MNTALGEIVGRLPKIERIPFESCPLCNFELRGNPIHEASCTAHELYDPRLPPTIKWVQCFQCKHVFTSGFFGEDAQKILFAKTPKAQEVGYDIEKQRFIAADMVERVLRHLPFAPERGWLDIGCGAGALLMTAAEYGFKATGIDLREDSAATLKAFGYDARNASITDVNSEVRFHVVSLCDVLEHVPQPRILLRQCHNRMRDGALLLVSMPNSDTSVWRILDAVKRNPYWGELEHYHNFSRESLYRLLGQEGFEPVSYGVSRRYRACMEVIARAV